MKCMSFIHINLDQRPRMTGLGFSICRFDGTGIYKSLEWERKCSRYGPAAKEVIQARQTQLETSGRNQQ